MSTVLLAGGETLVNVHSGAQCQSNGLRPCAIHVLTDHNMREFPQHFRSDTGLIERICPHGIGHPDPDSLPFFEDRGIKGMGIHGCDGCCRGEGPQVVNKNVDNADQAFPFNKIV